MSESVAAALAPALARPARAGARRAEAAQAAAAGGRRCARSCSSTPEVAGAIGAAELDAALDPGHYLGVTERLIDRALAAHRG